MLWNRTENSEPNPCINTYGNDFWQSGEKDYLSVFSQKTQLNIAAFWHNRNYSFLPPEKP